MNSRCSSMLARSRLHWSATVRESSTPEQAVNLENQWRTPSDTGQSLAARSSNCAQFGSNSPAKRIAFKFSCDLALMITANAKTQRRRATEPELQTGRATRRPLKCSGSAPSFVCGKLCGNRCQHFSLFLRNGGDGFEMKGPAAVDSRLLAA